MYQTKLLVVTIVICSLLIFEVVMMENGISFPLIISTLINFKISFIEPLEIIPFFDGLEIIDKYKNSFPIHSELYTKDNGGFTEYYDTQKILRLSAYPHEKTFVDLIIEINDEEFSYELYCTEEFTTVSKDLELINTKLDQCIEKFG